LFVVDDVVDLVFIIILTKKKIPSGSKITEVGYKVCLVVKPTLAGIIINVIIVVVIIVIIIVARSGGTM